MSTAERRSRSLAVPVAVLLSTSTYAVVHTVLLHHLLQVAQAQAAARAAAGLDPLWSPSGVGAWLPTGATLRFVALSALALALAAAGRRLAFVLPAAVVLVGVGVDDLRPLALDAAWSRSALVASPLPDPLARLWAGTALDTALLLLPAVVLLATGARRRPVLPAPVAVLRSAPLLVAVLAACAWAHALMGAAPAQYERAALLVVGTALLVTGGLRRLTALLLAVLLPALAVEDWSWPLAGHPEGLASAAHAAAVAGLFALAAAVLALGLPHAGRAWRRLLRPAPHVVDPAAA